MISFKQTKTGGSTDGGSTDGGSTENLYNLAIVQIGFALCYSSNTAIATPTTPNVVMAESPAA